MIQNIPENILFIILISFGVILVFVWYFSSNFNGLSSAKAMDQAQIARHISRGGGFRTSVIRPLELKKLNNIHAHKDGFYAPLHPFLTAIAFVFLGRNDRAAAASSSFFYFLTMVPLFLLSWKLFDRRAAILTLIIFATTETVLHYAISGTEAPLTTFLFTLLLFLLLDVNPKRMALSGCVFGLCWISCYKMVFFLVPLLLFVYFVGREKRVLSLKDIPEEYVSTAAFLIGLVLITTPYVIRNYAVFGNPFFSTQKYQLLTSTSEYPGTTIYRQSSALSISPIWFALTHPTQIIYKTTKNLRSLYSVSSLVNPLLLGFFAVKIFHSFIDQRVAGGDLSRSPSVSLGLGQSEKELLSVLIYAMSVLFILSALLTSVTSSIFLPIIPAVLSLAVGCFMHHVDSIQFRDKVFRIRSKLVMFRAGHVRGVVICALVAVCAFPLFWDLCFGEQKVDNPLPKTKSLKSLIPKDAVVISDIPWAVAWHAERTALWLPELKKDDSLKKTSGSELKAIYLSPAVLKYGEAEKVEGYKKMFLGKSQPRGFEQGRLFPELGVLFLRKSGGGED